MMMMKGGKPGRSCPGAGNSKVSGYHNRLGQTWVNWLEQNLCVHCQKTCPKGTFKCPDCHLRVRIVPHNHRGQRLVFGARRRLIKRAQAEAANLLKLRGWELPPARVSAK